MGLAAALAAWYNKIKRKSGFYETPVLRKEPDYEHI